MGLIYQHYEPFDIINNIQYFNITVVSEIIKKSVQTVRMWDVWSDQEDEIDGKRLIPKSTRSGKNNVRCWTASQIQQILDFSKSIKYGQLSKYSRKCWGERGKNIKRDMSIEGRKNRDTKRKQINVSAKNIQRRNKTAAIMKAKKEMLQAVRHRVRSNYENINYK